MLCIMTFRKFLHVHLLTAIQIQLVQVNPDLRVKCYALENFVKCWMSTIYFLRYPGFCFVWFEEVNSDVSRTAYHAFSETYHAAAGMLLSVVIALVKLLRMDVPDRAPTEWVHRDNPRSYMIAIMDIVFTYGAHPRSFWLLLTADYAREYCLQCVHSNICLAKHKWKSDQFMSQLVRLQTWIVWLTKSPPPPLPPPLPL